MNAIDHPHVFMRSLATRSDKNTIASSMDGVIALLIEAGYDFRYPELKDALRHEYA